MKPTRSDLLAIIKKTPRTTAQLKAIFPREDRGDIVSDVIAMEACGLIEAQPGSIFDGPSYKITERGEAALHDM